MNARFHSIQKKLEERLAIIENRVNGTLPRVPENKGASAAGVPLDWRHIEEGHVREKKSLRERMNVQKGEIEHLRRKLDETETRAKSLADKFQLQQANVRRLLEQWEKRLHETALASRSDGAEKSALEKEVAFLKAEVMTQSKRIEELRGQKMECEQSVQSKDGEIARFFTRIKGLETENETLKKKLARRDFSTTITNVPLAKPTKGPQGNTGFFQWLSKPMIVVKTEKKRNH